jgi:hypothetical protein
LFGYYVPPAQEANRAFEKGSCLDVVSNPSNIPAINTARRRSQTASGEQQVQQRYADWSIARYLLPCITSGVASGKGSCVYIPSQSTILATTSPSRASINISHFKGVSTEFLSSPSSHDRCNHTLRHHAL